MSYDIFQLSPMGIMAMKALYKSCAASAEDLKKAGDALSQAYEDAKNGLGEGQLRYERLIHAHTDATLSVNQAILELLPQMNSTIKAMSEAVSQTSGGSSGVSAGPSMHMNQTAGVDDSDEHHRTR